MNGYEQALANREQAAKAHKVDPSMFTLERMKQAFDLVDVYHDSYWADSEETIHDLEQDDG